MSALGKEITESIITEWFGFDRNPPSDAVRASLEMAVEEIIGELHGGNLESNNSVQLLDKVADIMARATGDA